MSANPSAFLARPDRVSRAQLIAQDARARIAILGMVIADDHRTAARIAAMSWPERPRVVRRRRRHGPDLSVRLVMTGLLEFVTLMAFLAVMTGLVFMFGP